MATHSGILPWTIHGQESLVGSRPWSCKELDVTEGTEHRHCMTGMQYIEGSDTLSEQNKHHPLKHKGHILLYFRSQLKTSNVL